MSATVSVFDGKYTAPLLDQDAHNVGPCETCLLHRKFLVPPAEETLLPHRLRIGADYPEDRSEPIVLKNSLGFKTI